MAMIDAWNRLVEYVQNFKRGGMALSDDVIERIAQLYEEFLNESAKEAPDSLDHMIGYISANGSKLVRKRDVPSVLRKDREFAEKFIAMLSA